MDAYEELRAEENESNLLTGYWNDAYDFLTHYGWYLLGLGLIIAYFKPYVEDTVDKMQRTREQKEFEAKCKKDPNLIESQRQAIESARLKMQEEHDKKAAVHAAKMKEKEDKKREELLSQEDGGNRLGNGRETTSDNTTTKKKTWRPEYNPLMGSGGSGYRPPRRSGCSGGGCG